MSEERFWVESSRKPPSDVETTLKQGETCMRPKLEKLKRNAVVHGSAASTSLVALLLVRYVQSRNWSHGDEPEVARILLISSALAIISFVTVLAFGRRAKDRSLVFWLVSLGSSIVCFMVWRTWQIL